MSSITMPDLLTVIYVLVDDWYQAEGVRLLNGKSGAKPTFSDSEVITLLLAMDFLPFPGQTQYLAFIRANYLPLFPRLVDPSQFNRRARALRLLVEHLRCHWAVQLGVTQAVALLLDTKPLPVVGYTRSKRHSAFAGSADYGYCASRKLHYFGYKLVLLTTLDGCPVAYELVPAHTDEREAAEAVVFMARACDIFGDKGFIGADWQANIYDTSGNRLWTAKRANQHQQNSPAFDAWLNSVRERIEGAFHEIQNTGRYLERLLTKTVLGLCTQVIAKVTSHTLRLLLRRAYGMDVLTFSAAA